MPIYEVKTKSGSEYMIDTEAGYWSRNSGYVERIHIFRVALKPTTLPWAGGNNPQWVDVKVPEVGMKMYLSSMDEWAISSVVVSVDEKP